MPFADYTFDFVTAFTSMMDVSDQAAAFVWRVLRPGGFLQSSISHPCFDPPHRRVLRDADGTTRAIEVARYFDTTEGRVDTRWFSTLRKRNAEQVAPFLTPRFHRTLSGWVEIICDAGLVIEQFPTLAELKLGVAIAPLRLELHWRVCGAYSPARIKRERASWRTRNRSGRPAKPKSPSRKRKAPTSGRLPRG